MNTTKNTMTLRFIHKGTGRQGTVTQGKDSYGRLGVRYDGTAKTVLVYATEVFVV